MTHPDKRTFTLQQVMMSLSAVAYMPFHSISMLQDNLNAVDTLEQAFTVVWWEKNSSLVTFVVKNRLTNAYAVVFRGEVFKPTLPFLVQLYEDLKLNRQESLPYSRLGNAKVAAGILEIIEDLGTSTYSGRTLQQVLNNLPAGTKVYMTGHSLGGSLAAVYAAKIVCSNSAQLDIIPYTFGSPSIGNDLFADLFDHTNVNFLFSQSIRCINIRDIMPFAWNNLQGMTTVDYGSIKCPVDFKLCIEYVDRLLIISRVFYSHPPPELALRVEDHGMDGFFQKALYQHQPNTYLRMLGLDPIEKARFYHNETKALILSDSE
jgi:Lipase (class 3)